MTKYGFSSFPCWVALSLVKINVLTHEMPRKMLKTNNGKLFPTHHLKDFKLMLSIQFTEEANKIKGDLDQKIGLHVCELYPSFFCLFDVLPSSRKPNEVVIFGFSATIYTKYRDV